jgi:hypothetical protein
MITSNKVVPTKAVEEGFNLGVWSVPHAAWIFADYSPFLTINLYYILNRIQSI